VECAERKGYIVQRDDDVINSDGSNGGTGHQKDSSQCVPEALGASGCARTVEEAACSPAGETPLAGDGGAIKIEIEVSWPGGECGEVGAASSVTHPQVQVGIGGAGSVTPRSADPAMDSSPGDRPAREGTRAGEGTAVRVSAADGEQIPGEDRGEVLSSTPRATEGDAAAPCHQCRCVTPSDERPYRPRHLGGAYTHSRVNSTNQTPADVSRRVTDYLKSQIAQ
jgi:hypothetical protein